MDVGRLYRLSHRLAVLRDILVHEEPVSDPPSEQDKFVYTGGEKGRQRDFKVIRSPNTQRKLEEWFDKRNIEIRIVYTEQRFKEDEKFFPNVTPIGQPGVITFAYMPVGQDPPTAWMVIHNLSHAIFDRQRYYRESPHEEKSGPEKKLPEMWESTFNLMGRNPKKPAIYPTTKSHQRGTITDEGEGFHELFAQWVVKGKVVLNPRNPKLEQELGNMFRSKIEALEDEGAVLYNV